MTAYWRERHYREHWTKPLDITFLYQLGTIAAQMLKRAEKDGDKELFDWAAQIRLIVARANGEELNIPLAEHQIAAPNVTPND
jgi:hypothetical protein